MNVSIKNKEHINDSAGRKKVQKVQFSDISMEFLCQFYVDQFERNWDTILLIYKNDEYVTNIAFHEAVALCTDTDPKFFFM